LATSPFGNLAEPSARKTLIYLIATLNSSFEGDYDYSSISPDEFTTVTSLVSIKNEVNTVLDAIISTSREGLALAQSVDREVDASCLGTRIWSALDEVVRPDECEIYQYRPDAESDPLLEDGVPLWRFYYFFFNKKLKRVALFRCRAGQRRPPEMLDDDQSNGYYSASSEDCFDMEIDGEEN